mmetsp:Transcript_21678/g.73454  ORF Transcript_21678/g.73454 Transcript_21678/m.73454 type:complete len:208 (+) Transcript_21678:3030-3653(+)
MAHLSHVEPPQSTSVSSTSRKPLVQVSAVGSGVVGRGVGLAVGFKVGCGVGAIEGLTVGFGVGCGVGFTVVGRCVGAARQIDSRPFSRAILFKTIWIQTNCSFVRGCEPSKERPSGSSGSPLPWLTVFESGLTFKTSTLFSAITLSASVFMASAAMAPWVRAVGSSVSTPQHDVWRHKETLLLKKRKMLSFRLSKFDWYASKHPGSS